MYRNDYVVWQPIKDAERRSLRTITGFFRHCILPADFLLQTRPQDHYHKDAVLAYQTEQEHQAKGGQDPHSLLSLASGAGLGGGRGSARPADPVVVRGLDEHWRVLFFRRLWAEHTWLRLFYTSSSSSSSTTLRTNNHGLHSGPAAQQLRSVSWLLAVSKLMVLLTLSTIVTSLFFADNGACHDIEDMGTCNDKVLGSLTSYVGLKSCTWNMDNRQCIYRRPAVSFVHLIIFTTIVSLVSRPLYRILELLCHRLAKLLHTQLVVYAADTKHRLHRQKMHKQPLYRVGLDLLKKRGLVAPGDVDFDDDDHDAEHEVEDVDAMQKKGGMSGKRSVNDEAVMTVLAFDQQSSPKQQQLVLPQTMRSYAQAQQRDELQDVQSLPAKLLRSARLTKQQREIDYLLPTQEVDVLLNEQTRQYRMTGRREVLLSEVHASEYASSVTAVTGMHSGAVDANAGLTLVQQLSRTQPLVLSHTSLHNRYATSTCAVSSVAMAAAKSTMRQIRHDYTYGPNNQHNSHQNNSHGTNRNVQAGFDDFGDDIGPRGGSVSSTVGGICRWLTLQVSSLWSLAPSLSAALLPAAYTISIGDLVSLITLTRRRADYLKHQLDGLADNTEAQEIHLLQAFLVHLYGDYRLPFLSRFIFFGAQQQEVYTSFQYMYRLVSVVIGLPVVLVGMVFAVLYLNTDIGSRATGLWAGVWLLCFCIDVFLAEPFRIFWTWIVLLQFSGLRRDISHLLYALELRYEHIVNSRVDGIMSDCHALVQHFNPACRVARLYPSLPIARLLFSLNDYDVPLFRDLNLHRNQASSLDSPSDRQFGRNQSHKSNDNSQNNTPAPRGLFGGTSYSDIFLSYNPSQSMYNTSGDYPAADPDAGFFGWWRRQYRYYVPRFVSAFAHLPYALQDTLIDLLCIAGFLALLVIFYYLAGVSVAAAIIVAIVLVVVIIVREGRLLPALGSHQSSRLSTYAHSGAAQIAQLLGYDYQIPRPYQTRPDSGGDNDDNSLFTSEKYVKNKPQKRSVAIPITAANAGAVGEKAMPGAPPSATTGVPKSAFGTQITTLTSKDVKQLLHAAPPAYASDSDHPPSRSRPPSSSAAAAASPLKKKPTANVVVLGSTSHKPHSTHTNASTSPQRAVRSLSAQPRNQQQQYHHHHPADEEEKKDNYHHGHHHPSNADHQVRRFHSPAPSSSSAQSRSPSPQPRPHSSPAPHLSTTQTTSVPPLPLRGGAQGGSVTGGGVVAQSDDELRRMQRAAQRARTRNNRLNVDPYPATHNANTNGDTSPPLSTQRSQQSLLLHQQRVESRRARHRHESDRDGGAGGPGGGSRSHHRPHDVSGTSHGGHRHRQRSQSRSRSRSRPHRRHTSDDDENDEGESEVEAYDSDALAGGRRGAEEEKDGRRGTHHRRHQHRSQRQRRQHHAPSSTDVHQPAATTATTPRVQEALHYQMQRLHGTSSPPPRLDVTGGSRGEGAAAGELSSPEKPWPGLLARFDDAPRLSTAGSGTGASQQRAPASASGGGAITRTMFPDWHQN